MHIYSYLFCLYWCKDYCHRVTTELQLIIIIICGLSLQGLGGKSVKLINKGILYD